jgi:hypothetical protein
VTPVNERLLDTTSPLVRIVLFGTGTFAERVYNLLSVRKDFEIVVVADNDPHKQGVFWHKIPVVGPRELDGFEWDKVLVASLFSSDIVSTLVDAGIEQFRISVLDSENISSTIDRIAPPTIVRVSSPFGKDGYSPIAKQFPAVLIVTTSPVNSTHGTGVALQRLFSKFPADNLFNIYYSDNGKSSVKQNLCAFSIEPNSSLEQQLLRKFSEFEFFPELIYSTANNEVCAGMLETVVKTIPERVPIIQHFLDFMPYDSGQFCKKMSSVLNYCSHKSEIWAINSKLAKEINVLLKSPVEIVSALFQNLPASYKKVHNTLDSSFRAAMIGNLWQPKMLPVINRIWQRCRSFLPDLRPIDWYVHPLRVQALIDAGYEIGDEVVWRGFVPDLQKKIEMC